jgi:hypothetical protein
MSKLNITGTVGSAFSRFTVEGVEGGFQSVSNGGFCRIKHWLPEGGYKLVCSVSNGNYGSDGIRPQANPDKHTQIMEKLETYVGKSISPA